METKLNSSSLNQLRFYSFALLSEFHIVALVVIGIHWFPINWPLQVRPLYGV